MKALVKNNEIKIYSPIPKYWKSDTINMSGFDRAPDSVHEAEGFFNVAIPEFDEDTEYLGDYYFDPVDRVVKVQVLARDLPTIEVAKAAKIRELKEAVRELYYTVHSYITEKQIHDEVIPTAVKDKIKSIRTKYLQVKSQIEALTTVVDVVKYRLPYDQINTLREQLQNIE